MSNLLPFENRLKRYSRERNIQQPTAQLDYLLSWLLASIASDPILGKELVFKGGTALKKCYFDRYRFSEDLDFTALKSLPVAENLLHRMEIVTKKAETRINEYVPIALLCEIYPERQPHPEGQQAFRIRAQFPGQREPQITAKIEITFAERLLYPVNLCPIFHGYGEVIEERVQTYQLGEVILEKLRGILQHTKKLHERGWTRSRTRDYYDLYKLLLHEKDLFRERQTLIYLTLKCIDKGVGFDNPNSFFDPLFIKEVHKDWQHHLGYLTDDLPPVEQVLERLKTATTELLLLQPSLGQTIGWSNIRCYLNGNNLIEYCRWRLDHGADPNDEMNDGHHPLNIAVADRQRDLALLLIEHGAKSDLKDKSGYNAFELALNRELYDLAYEMHKRGYSYTPRHSDQTLKVPHQNLYKFDQHYFI